MYHKMLIGWFTAGLLFFVALCRSIANVIASLSLNDATNFTAVLTVIVPAFAGALAGFFIIVIPGWAKAKAAARKIDDESRKGSLSAQLDEVNANLEKARKTQHEIRDQLEIFTNDNYLLRKSLRDAETNFVKASHELLEANEKNDELRAELYSLRGALSQLGREEEAHHKETKGIVRETQAIVGETKAIVVKAVESMDKVASASSSSSSSGEIPAFQNMQPSPPQNPAIRPAT